MRISKTRIMSKREERLIKQNMTGNVDSVRSRIKAYITFRKRRIAKKDTKFRLGLQLMLVKRRKVWVSGATKCFKSMKRWWF